MEQHIHCALCGRVMEKPAPGSVTPAVYRGAFCSVCESAFNINVDKIAKGQVTRKEKQSH